MNSRLSIRDQLSVAGRGRDRAIRLATLLTLVGLLLLLFLGVALLDYQMILPASIRWAALSVFGVTAILGGIRLWQLWHRPTSLKQSALEVEAVRPDVGCEVSTAAEYLTGERRVSQEFEQELVTALQQRAAETVTHSPLPHRRSLLLPGMAVALGMLSLAAFVAVLPSAVTALQRTAAPWSPAAFSRVTVSPGVIEVPVGRALEITGKFRGRQPERAELRVREAGQRDWTIRPLTADTNGVFRHTLAAVGSSFAYQVTGLDAVSEEFPVTSYVPPEIREVRVRLEAPAYTGLKPIEQSSADITIVRGSRATLRVLPTVALSKAQLRFTNGVVVALKFDASQQWTAQLPVDRDAEFRFELFDAQGRRGGDEQAHHITAVPDAPPKVDFATPGQDIRAAATNRIDLKLTASDDFGVAGVKIFYHRLGAPELELTAPRLVAKGAELQGETSLDLAPLQLKEFELVAYHAEVRDNNTLDGPGIGRSPTYFIEITDLKSGQCLCQGQGQKVNLLVIQKQIIADTTALAAAVPVKQYMELAARQQDALEFAKLYQQALTQAGAPSAAQGALQAAMESMEQAATALWSRSRDTALAPEESALASLYQLVRLMPELQNLPTTPPPLAEKTPPTPPAVKVVLEAIKQQKKEPVDRKEIARLLEQAKQLSRQQAGLNASLPGTGSASGKGAAPGQGQAAAGAPKPNPAAPGQEAKELAKLAPKQEQLSAEARELAARIARQAGKGSRMGHGAGQRMSEAAAKMGQAAQAMRSGQGETAGTAGDESESSLGIASAMLEELLSGRPELSDVSAEDAPKQYEAAIADYFKRLSHAE